MSDPVTNFPIQHELLRDAQMLAKELNLSWEQVLTLALRNFIRRYGQRQSLTEQINAAYADSTTQDETPDETTIVQAMRSHHLRIIAEDPW